MPRQALRVVYITRRHLVAALFLVALVAGVAGALRERAAPTLSSLPGDRTPPMDAPVRQVAGAMGEIALTVNVDWGNDELGPMLDIFDRYGVKVTFFLTGRWARLFPDFARELAARGHEIGNHGLSHAHPTALSAGQLRELIEGNARLLVETVGEEAVVPLFAPPYGEQDRRVVEAAAALGHWTTLWTLDTVDWQEPPPATIVSRVVPRATDGAIVLMHPKPQTVQALPTILEGLAQRGFKVVPLYEMMGRPAP